MSETLNKLGTIERRLWRAARLKIDPRCDYCGAILSASTATVDHVQSRSRGGGSGPNNYALSCHPCNKRKGDKTLAEAGMSFRVGQERWKVRTNGKARP